MSPIRASERARYPKNWKEITARIRARADDSCECLGECGVPHRWEGSSRCPEVNRLPAAHFNGRVILTVAHLDHTPENCAGENLKAMCQACHLRYDRDHHAATRRARRESANGTPLLFPIASSEAPAARRARRAAVGFINTYISQRSGFGK